MKAVLRMLGQAALVVLGAVLVVMIITRPLDGHWGVLLGLLLLPQLAFWFEKLRVQQLRERDPASTVEVDERLYAAAGACFLLFLIVSTLSRFWGQEYFMGVVGVLVIAWQVRVSWRAYAEEQANKGL